MTDTPVFEKPAQPKPVFEEPARRPADQQCIVITKRTGERCRRAAFPGSELCSWHGGQPPRTKPRVRRGASYLKRMTPLMDHPGEWARIFAGQKHSAVVTIARFRNHAVPEGTPRVENEVVVPGDPACWEYEIGEIKSNSWGVYARYLGEPDDPPEGAEIAWDETGASWVPVTSTNGAESHTEANRGT